ncbi:glycosyltransferase family A protein [Chryseolinea lacunae]|uniref:Glycosyltransferase family 2 protein n=1 Tax=Chryseolinea lacunae TaxID=2801331 RepID=A0ABS1KSX7_9BACT|nr:glycosyltransferase family A protein [Chryseolinea lacunae]MBL0741381.1 glycosyltransferase family 2 protein [Chryseolinea lacunae]
MLKDITEFVLVDLSSKDGLQHWVLSNFKEALDEGYLRYFYTEEMPAWHASIAKNTAHYYGMGEFLVNLDGDNLIGANGSAFVLDQFLQHGEKLLLHQFDGDYQAGSYGRIGMHNKYFRHIGGYDEALEPMGHEDMDLINRLAEFGLMYRRFPDAQYIAAIKNTKEDSIKNCDSRLSWEEMEFRNSRRSCTNLLAGRIVSNQGHFGIRKNMLTYKSGAMVPVEHMDH